MDNIITELIKYRKNGTQEPMDGDEVDDFCHLIKAHINYREGNLTLSEFTDLIQGVYPQRKAEET